MCWFTRQEHVSSNFTIDMVNNKRQRNMTAIYLQFPEKIWQNLSFRAELKLYIPLAH